MPSLESVSAFSWKLSTSKSMFTTPHHTETPCINKKGTIDLRQDREGSILSWSDFWGHRNKESVSNRSMTTGILEKSWPSRISYGSLAFKALERLSSGEVSATSHHLQLHINHFNSISAEHGTPARLMTVNVPQYSYREFKRFVSFCGAEHITSSPM